MNEQELRSLVERMVADMAGKSSPPAETAPPPSVHAPQVTAQAPQVSSGETLPDISVVDLRKQYLLEHPHNKAAFMELKAKTPARLGMGRAGARYKTETMLRVRADHAAAQDSVFSFVSEDFVRENGFTAVQTLCQSKDEYLTRPDKGRRFDEENQAIIRKTLGERPKVALVIGDGLSSAAIEANAKDCLAAIRAGLQNFGIEAGNALFVQYCRVGASDHIGELTGTELVCMLVGERPGLVTAESMSAYITYGAKIGIPESKRTVISNIHRQGTTAVEAGAHIAELIRTMLEKKASGVELAQMERGRGA